MTAKEAIKQLQTEHDLIAQEHDLDGSQFALEFLEALAMAISALEAQNAMMHIELPEVSAEEAVEILKRNNRIELTPSDKDTNVPSKDCIDRAEAQTAIQFAARRYTVAHEAHGEGHVVWSDNLISVTDAMNALREVPPAHPEQQRTFVELVVEYPEPELCTYKEYKGKPYYSIKYIENGETYVGYGTYNPKVLSRYLSEYFISSAQPDKDMLHLQKEQAYMQGWADRERTAQPERPKGEWILSGENKYTCSVCGKTIITNKDYIKEHKWCFGCGADMRGEQDDSISD